MVDFSLITTTFPPMKFDVRHGSEPHDLCKALSPSSFENFKAAHFHIHRCCWKPQIPFLFDGVPLSDPSLSSLFLSLFSQLRLINHTILLRRQPYHSLVLALTTSFGYGVSNFLVLSKLAWDVVQNFSKACGAHADLTCEARSLHMVL
jgi:hypothetical protein